MIKAADTSVEDRLHDCWIRVWEQVACSRSRHLPRVFACLKCHPHATKFFTI